MDIFWQRALGELRSGRWVYFSIVAAAKKGSPGTSAARMLVFEDGNQFGTIGGGVMEGAVLREAIAVLGARKRLHPELVVLKHRNTEGELSSGLICGGEQSNISFTLSGADCDLVEALARAETQEQEAVLKITRDGLSLTPGAGDFCSVAFDGNEWSYRYNFVNQRRIAIFGGGHCGVELAKVMSVLGYAVTVVDPRKDLFTLDHLPMGVDLIQLPFDRATSEIKYPRKTLVAVMTYSMLTDIDALSGILKSDFPFVGLMGSKPKIARIQKTLLDMGFSKIQVDQLRAPIGLEFNSDTPQEIAVSIAAQILLERESR